MKKINTFIFIIYLTTWCLAQKKPLDHSVYDGWQKIGNKWLAPNGTFLAYTVDVQEGDGTLYIKNLITQAQIDIPRGFDATFSSSSKYLITRIKPLYKEIRQAKIAKKRTEELPKDSLAIVDLTNFIIQKTGAIKSYALTEENKDVLVFLEEPTFEKSKTNNQGEKEGNKLMVQLLGSERYFTAPYVSEYHLHKKGKALVFESTGSKKDSVHHLPFICLLNLENGQIDTIATGAISASKFAFNEAGDELAFVATKDSTKALVKRFHLRVYKILQDSAHIVLDHTDTSLPKGWHLSEHYPIRFSKDGRRIVIGTAPIPTPRDTTVSDIDLVKVDVWHYNDDYLQPMQLKNLDQELKRAYLGIYESGRFIQVGHTDLETITMNVEDTGRWALGRTDKGQRIALQWEGDTKEDVYIIDLLKGDKNLIKDNLDGNVSLSPNGKYAIWYDHSTKHYHSYNTNTGQTKKITEKIKVPLADELNDEPDDPNPYGIAGWLENDDRILIYDRWDIWSVDPNGLTDALNITKSMGRKNQITFRNIWLDPKQKYIKTDQVLLLSAFRYKDKQAGYYALAVDKNMEPQQQCMGPYSYHSVLKAKNNPTLAYLKGNLKDNMDLYTSLGFDQEQKHSAINPQQKDYNWMQAELMHWKTFKQKPASGLLYKPENFDPAKKYPMVVYFYEKNTDNLHQYLAPAPTPSRLNIPYFVSNDYLVFVPDITYEIGYPGPSAYDHIVSGVEHLKKNEWVDGQNIGIQGQSWGGYQALYIITQTNLFKAAWTGAPVVNMFSAYGGIRWESGRNRQMQYEKQQSRLGADPWKRRDLYIQNSPFFYLPAVTTPLAIMANDADGAVPWYQGIELFTAMRRLQKKVWMLNYNGEAHNLTERKNQKDISIREQQFFDHFLKNKPAPAWLESGIPATEKGKNPGLEIKKKT